MSKGRPCYPPFFRDFRKLRQRVFVWMSVSRWHNSVTFLTEKGRRYQYGLTEYEAAKRQALGEGWTIFCSFKRSGQAFPWIAESIQDKAATVLASTRRLIGLGSITGVAWRVGNKRASVLDPDTWGFSDMNTDGQYCSPLTFLMYVRRCCQEVGIGDFDTPAALGTARLNRYWQEQGLPRLWILPRDCRHWLATQPVHPRIYDIETDVTYPLLRESDLRSAYSTALAGDLPLGQPCYVTSEDAACGALRTGISYGLWRVRVTENIFYGPVCRAWEEKPSLHLFPGEYTIALFGEEAAALQECGADCRFIKGYLWTKVGRPLLGLVTELKQLRQKAEAGRHEPLAEMLKKVPNALIGRFNSTEECTIVPENQAQEGDIILDLLPGGDGLPYESDTLVALHTEQNECCLPVHWYQYLVMKVGLQIWRRTREEMAAGYTVVGANIDSLRVIQPTLEWTESNPSEWKEFIIRNARVKASRHIDGEVLSTDGTWKRIVKAPGIKRRLRE